MPNPTPRFRVCAVVVTFHPGKGALRSLPDVRAQVQSLIVVDNGSGPEMMAWLRAQSTAVDFKLIEVGENLGIAAAQNLGIAAAQAAGAEFVTFFDQDSSVPSGFVATLVDFYEHDFARFKIAVVAPRYLDSRFQTMMEPRRMADGNLEVAMSSGSLIPLAALRELGPFEAGLFIDYVDYEFCLRAREAGYVLRECEDAVLLHAPADPQRYRFLFVLGITSATYTPFRRYYLSRNLVWMLRRYSAVFPAVCLRFALDFLKDSVKIVLVESNAWDKTRASLRGIADGLRGRMGRTF